MHYSLLYVNLASRAQHTLALERGVDSNTHSVQPLDCRNCRYSESATLIT